MDKGKYYITTAIAYTSGKPHIGNVYEIVLADAIARYKRMCGLDVYFQTGTDEHGQKIQEKAEAMGLSPQQFVDQVAGEIRRNWDLMNTSYDRFIRTTDPVHEKKVQEIFTRLYKQGDIYKGKYEGMYCTPCESFFTPGQLRDGKCPDCGGEVHPASEEAYFFKLSKYAPRLMEHIENNPEFIQPEARKNEMINNFLKPGLQDLCVSRSTFTWGVPVEFDPGHVVYVWIDALSNYITFPGYDASGNHGEQYKKYWPADVHLIGKDILRFHTTYWPILLMALGEELPRQVFGHPWLLMGEGKMSKSKGNVMYADDLVELFGVDAIRYYLLHEMPFAADGTITFELLIERINSDLANILGNLVNRTLTMLHKYCDGAVSPGASADPDPELEALCLETPKKVEAAMDGLHVADAISHVFTLARRANKYIDETLPWALSHDVGNLPRLQSVLYHLLEAIRFCATLLAPFLPQTSGQIFRQMNLPAQTLDSLASFGGIPEGHRIGRTEILFARLDGAKKLEEIEAYYQRKNAPKEEAPSVALISIDDFAKMELRTAKVTACEKVPKADKLLKLQLDVGGERRQIVSGIAQYYQPEDMVGRTIVMVYNLEPAKLRGVDSQGMLLAANDGGVIKVLFADDVASGCKVK